MSKCSHKITTIRYGSDDGSGMERTQPRSWRYKECTKCGAVTAVEVNQPTWIIAPEGSKAGPYGIEFPNGYVY